MANVKITELPTDTTPASGDLIPFADVDADRTEAVTVANLVSTANVTAAGALMDSEVDADIKTLSLPANTTISAFGATLVDDADQATARATLGVAEATLDARYATTSSGAGAPVSTPSKVGDIYVDTTNDDAYIAVGTASSADWEKSNDGAGSGSTDLSWSAATSTVASSTGTDAVLTAVDGSNPGLMTVAMKSKLDGIETAADVTDATNVAAAGAVMESDTSTASMSFVIDEDAMTSNSATKVPTQQSVKAYADTMLPKVAGGASVENIGAVESNVQTVAATGAAETLDAATYGVFDMTMDQACEFTFSNPAPSGKATTFVLVLRGAFTPTLPASVDWADASAPTYTTPSIYTFTTVDAGTTWLGAQVGKAYG